MKNIILILGTLLSIQVLSQAQDLASINQIDYSTEDTKVNNVMAFVNNFEQNRGVKKDVKKLNQTEKNEGKILSEQRLKYKDAIILHLYVPETADNAAIVLTDHVRKLSKRIPLNKVGETQVVIDNVDKNDYPMAYSLIVDNHHVDSKHLKQ